MPRPEPVYRDEKALCNAIKKAIEREWSGSWVTKIHGSAYQTSGIPDLLCSVKGRFIGLEVKHQKPGESREHAIGRTTDTQHGQIMKINASGGFACTVLTVSEALEAVRWVLQETRRNFG